MEYRPEEFRRERRLSITMAHSHKRSMTWDDESGSGSDHETPAVEVETAQVLSKQGGTCMTRWAIKHFTVNFHHMGNYWVIIVPIYGKNCST